MKREERITEICKQCNAMLGEPLANAIARAISEGYKLGLDGNKQIITDKIVYVVTRSENHSDYVEAVFCKRENAEKYCKQFNDNEDEYSRDITEVKCLDTQPTNHWHKVEDELPPRIRETVNVSKAVLVTNGLSYGTGYYNYNLNKWFCVGTTNITHWMELPELPKEE